MTTVLGANTLSSGGYEVGNSLRENRADSAFLYKTFDDDGTHHDKGTISVWVKRSEFGAEAMIYAAGASAREFIRFETNDTLTYRSVGAGYHLNTNRVFKDPSAWYHIVVAFDSSQGTASNRNKIYVNGVQETSFATETYTPNQNMDHKFLSGELQRLGRDSEQANPFANCYFCEVVGIDGVAHAPTSFGEFDEDSGIWKPISVSGLTFGTNGFHLNFEDSSAFGTDVSGNGNDFANTNFAAVDQATDTCTNNFATWNPLRKHLGFSSTFTEGSTIVEHGEANQNQSVFSTMAVSTGKWYAEFQCSTNASNFAFGIARINTTNEGGLDSFPSSLGGVAYAKNGEIWYYADGDADSDTGTTYAHTDIIGILFDLDNTRIYFYKNDTLVNSGGFNYSVGTAVDGSIFETTYYFAAGSSDAGTNPILQANFGGSSGFAISSAQSDPNGFGNFEFATKGGYALCTKNLAEYG